MIRYRTEKEIDVVLLPTMANCEPASASLLLLVEASVAVDPYQSRQQPIWPSSGDVDWELHQTSKIVR